MDSEANDRLGKILDYIGSGNAPYAGTGARKGDIGLGDGYTPISPFIPGLADVVGAYRSGSDLDMFYDMMGLEPVDGNPNLVNIPTNTLNIDGKTIQKTLNDAFAAAGLDQQGNPLKEDDLSNPLLAPNPLLADEAANTGPFVTDPAAGTDTPVASGGNDTVADEDNTEAEITSETPEDILAKYSNKDRADPVTDMLGDYKQEDGTNFPVNVLIGIISDYAINKDNKDAQVILGKWNDKVGANQAAAAANNQVDSGAEDTGIPTGGTPTGGTPTGGTPQGQTVTPQGETSTPQGSTPIPQGGTPQGGTPASDTPAVDSPNGTPTVSTGSVLDQTGTENVNVDDQPIGLPNIPISTPIQPEKKAGMIMQISQSAPIVETFFDDILFEPKFTKLDNIPDFNLPSGLLRTLV